MNSTFGSRSHNSAYRLVWAPAVIIIILMFWLRSFADPGPSLTPESFGASHSTKTTTCAITSSSRVLFCPEGIEDFRIGQGIDIRAAGPPSPLADASDFHATFLGQQDSVFYKYKLCTADPWKGIVGCSTALVANGPSRLALRNSIALTFVPNGVNAALYLIYRQLNNEPWRFVTVINRAPFYDIGGTPPDSAGWPPTPPEVKINQDLFSHVVAVSSNSITIADSPTIGLSKASVKHDDATAFRAALAACNGGTVSVGPYNYRIVRPTVWSYRTQRFYDTFSASLPGYPSLYGQGLLQLSSHCTVRGASATLSILTTDFMGNSSGQTSTFGLNTGEHSNPFWLTASPRYLLENSSAGSPTVTLADARNAEHLSPEDNVLIYGGAYLPKPYVSSELNHIASLNRQTGVMSLSEALEKPLPVGRPDIRPSIVNLNGNVVTDVSLSELTIKNYSGGFYSTSAVNRAYMTDLALPVNGNADVWSGGFRRHWTVDRSTFVGSQEFDMDEDFSFNNGAWSAYGGGIFASEASSNIRFTKSHLTYIEMMCQNGVICSDHSSGFSSQVSVAHFALIGNTITVKDNLDSDKENNWAIAVQGGIIADYIGAGDEISDNELVTNARYGIAIQSPLDQRIDNNRLTMITKAAGNSFPIRAPEALLKANTITTREAAP